MNAFDHAITIPASSVNHEQKALVREHTNTHTETVKPASLIYTHYRKLG